MMRFNVLIAVAVASVLELSAAWNEGAPKINGPRVFGATPARDFTYAFPTTGSREALRFRVSSGSLPSGAVLDERRGVLSGRVAKSGEYGFSVTAENAFGKSVKPFTLVIREDALALTPPMGWTSWNAFMSDIDQELIAATAKAIVEKGLAAHGYAYVNIDSCWQGRRNRKGSQALQPNELFPDMGGLVKDIHALGLKAGIYSTPMVLAWGMTQPWGCDDSRLLPGSTAHPLDPDYYHPHFGGCGKRGMEKYDAAQFAEWGFDWLKYDWSYTEPFHARRMREALDATGRDIILQVCTGCQVSNAVEYSECVQLARGMADTFDDWTKLRDWNMKHVDPWLHHVRPGFWCDMDMMSVGMMCIDRRDVRAARPGEKPDPRTKNHLTPEELQSHFAWWAIIPTPLFLSCDIINMDAATLDLVTNDDLIGINQDYPARPAAYEDFDGGRRRVWTRQLSDGRIALGFFNLGDDDWRIERRLAEGRLVRDVLSRTDLGVKESLSLD